MYKCYTPLFFHLKSTPYGMEAETLICHDFSFYILSDQSHGPKLKLACHSVRTVCVTRDRKHL